MAFYRGEIAFVMKSKGFLFITEASILRMSDGKPCELRLNGDLFCHTRENHSLKLKKLTSGQILTFDICDRQRNDGSHRFIACNADLEKVLL